MSKPNNDLNTSNFIENEVPHSVLADKTERRYGLNCIYTNADILTNKMN